MFGFGKSKKSKTSKAKPPAIPHRDAFDKLPGEVERLIDIAFKQVDSAQGPRDGTESRAAVLECSIESTKFRIREIPRGEEDNTADDDAPPSPFRQVLRLGFGRNGHDLDWEDPRIWMPAAYNRGVIVYDVAGEFPDIKSMQSADLEEHCERQGKQRLIRDRFGNLLDQRIVSALKTFETDDKKILKKIKLVTDAEYDRTVFAKEYQDLENRARESLENLLRGIAETPGDTPVTTTS